MNIEDIRKKLAAAQGNKPTRLIWKPKGEHTVRLMALPGEADITETVQWHYGVDEGRKMYCPQTTGDACPFCDLAQSLRGWRDAAGNEKSEADRKRDWDAFRKLQAAIKYYAPVIVRKAGGEPDDIEGAFWWEMTPKVREKLLTVCADDDYNADSKDGGGSRVLTSPTNGLDLIVKLKKAGTDGNKTAYDMTEVTERKRGTTMFKDKSRKAPELAVLQGALEIVSTAQAEKIFASWEASLGSEPAATDDNAGTEHGSANGEKALSGKASVEDVISKLDSLIGEQQPKA
jgi:hypothetical protein